MTIPGELTLDAGLIVNAAAIEMNQLLHQLARSGTLNESETSRCRRQDEGFWFQRLKPMELKIRTLMKANGQYDEGWVKSKFASNGDYSKALTESQKIWAIIFDGCSKMAELSSMILEGIAWYPGETNRPVQPVLVRPYNGSVTPVIDPPF